MTFTLVLAALVYTRGWYRLRSALPNRVPTWRLATFMAGLFSIWIAVGSPIAALDHELLSIHMLQHCLLMAVGPPLILLGAPVLSLRHGLPERIVHGVLVPVLRWSPGRVLTHPVFCWLAGAVTIVGWHVPALFDLGMRSHWWHETQRASFFAAGLLFWIPVVQPWPSVARWPRWSIPFYLFLATLPCDALSAFLTFCDRVVYESYLSGPALQDQERAGAFMWVFVTFVYLIPAVAVTIQILSPPKLGPKRSPRLCKAGWMRRSDSINIGADGVVVPVQSIESEQPPRPLL